MHRCLYEMGAASARMTGMCPYFFYFSFVARESTGAPHAAVATPQDRGLGRVEVLQGLIPSIS